MIQTPSDKHAYVFTPTADKLLGAWAGVNGPETEFILSHVCSPSGKCQALDSYYFSIEHHLIFVFPTGSAEVPNQESKVTTQTQSITVPAQEGTTKRRQRLHRQ